MNWQAKVPKCSRSRRKVNIKKLIFQVRGVYSFLVDSGVTLRAESRRVLGPFACRAKVGEKGRKAWKVFESIPAWNASGRNGPIWSPNVADKKQTPLTDADQPRAEAQPEPAWPSRFIAGKLCECILYFRTACKRFQIQKEKVHRNIRKYKIIWQLQKLCSTFKLG